MESESTEFKTLSFNEVNAKLKEVGLLLKAHELSEVNPKVVERIIYRIGEQAFEHPKELIIDSMIIGSDKSENV